MASLARQNYHPESEAAVNKLINLELHASYVYLSMSYYFDRDDVALPGFHAFYRTTSERERRRAEKLMRFQNSRGGRIVFQDIQKPQRDEWGGAAEALQATLELEKTVNKSLLDLHAVADKHTDYHMTNFIEDEFLGQRVKIIKMISDMIANVKRVGPGLGIYVLDSKLEDRASQNGGPTDAPRQAPANCDDHGTGSRCPFGVR